MRRNFANFGELANAKCRLRNLGLYPNEKENKPGPPGVFWRNPAAPPSSSWLRQLPVGFRLQWCWTLDSLGNGKVADRSPSGRAGGSRLAPQKDVALLPVVEYDDVTARRSVTYLRIRFRQISQIDVAEQFY